MSVRMQREILRYRVSLMRLQTRVKNRIHVILANRNITHGFTHLFGKQGQDFLMSLLLTETYRIALNGCLSVLVELRRQLKAVGKKIAGLVKDDEEAKLLMTMPGIGYYSALLLKSETGTYIAFHHLSNCVPRRE